MMSCPRSISQKFSITAKAKSTALITHSIHAHRLQTPIAKNANLIGEASDSCCQQTLTKRIGCLVKKPVQKTFKVAPKI